MRQCQEEHRNSFKARATFGTLTSYSREKLYIPLQFCGPERHAGPLSFLTAHTAVPREKTAEKLREKTPERLREKIVEKFGEEKDRNHSSLRPA